MSETIPVSWPEKTIQSLLNSQSLFCDGDWVESKDQDAEGNNRLIQLADIGEGCFLDKSRKYLNDRQFVSLRCTELMEGDLLVARMPDPIGRACLFPLVNQRCATVVDVAILRKPDADIYWLMSMINSAQFRRQIEIHSTGTTRTRISRGFLGALKLPVPKRETQQKIGDILRTIDEAIAHTEALIKKYQLIKAGLMQDLFTRGVTADGKLRPPREEAPELYKETAIGWIPKEWKINTTVELSDQTPGSTVIGPFGSDLVAADYRSDGVPVIFVRDVKADLFDWISNVYVSDQKAQKLRAHRVKSGDLLATKMGLPPCISCVYPEGQPDGIITADIIRLTPNQNKVNVNWLSATLNHDRTLRQVAAITSGVTRPKVTLSDFRKLQVAVPQISEQYKIFQILEHQQSLIAQEISNVIKLKKSKSGLMNDLLTGQVTVSVKG